jgi:glycosyltransferase involved in cell wall biosynthesis
MQPKIIFFITEDRFLWSHRLPIARAALRNGYEVIIVTRVIGNAQRILDEGFRLIPLQLRRGSYNPLVDIQSVRELRRIYRAEQPNIVHNVALKPVLYGTAAGIGLHGVQVVNALTGLGFLASSQSFKARMLRPLIWRLLRFLLRRPNQRLLLQNEEDREFLTTRLGVKPDQITLIRGSGVDMDVFRPSPEPDGVPVVMFASRMLWIKGVREFVEAATALRKKGCSARFVLVGDSDIGSPSSVPREQLLKWQESGAVEWWGHRQDMAAVFKQASLVCLPSQGGEGVPKTLIEAAASGRAIVTTDVAGCRDIVHHGLNGILVPPQNVPALVRAIEELVGDPERRLLFGGRSRKIAAADFSEDLVVGETLRMYNDALQSSFAPAESALRARELQGQRER